MESKSWERPWSMEEIIENSDKWSLAGDVALLNSLKSFADNLIKKTSEINTNLTNLNNNLDETSLKLNIARNEFQSLRNTQFIESRVYDDDETLWHIKNDNKKVEEKVVSKDHTNDIKMAALRGLKVIDQYYEKVEVCLSDSEDDDADLPSYILRPIDLYIDRPLPYVIGSDEWHRKWHVGLEDSTSGSENDENVPDLSDSDSECDLPIADRSQIKGTSDTSSETDFMKNHPPTDLFIPSDSESQNSGGFGPPITDINSKFADELAKKLGSVVGEEQINKRPIQTPKTQEYGDNLFFNQEPPPIDQGKLFSRGDNLFDQEDDEDEYFTPTVERKIGNIKGGLFDEDDSDSENGIFGVEKTILPTFNNKAPFIDEEPPEFEDKKKPVGGVSIFGGANLFDKKLLKKQPTSSDDEEEIQKNKDEKDNEKMKVNKKFDLFKDENDEILINNSSKIEEKQNKVDIDHENRTKSSLFNDDSQVHSLKQKQTIENLNKNNKKLSLFDDDDDDDDIFKSDLFLSGPKKFKSNLFNDDETNEETTKKTNELFEKKDKNTSSLFGDLLGEMTDNKTFSINDKTESFNEIRNEKSVSNSDLTEKVTDSIKKTIEAKKFSLFDSPPPEEDEDDLFGDADEKINYLNFKIPELLNDKIEQDLVSNENKIGAKTTTGLFNDSPPPLFGENDMADDIINKNHSSVISEKSSLFESDETNDKLFDDNISNVSKVTSTSKISSLVGGVFDEPPPFEESDDDLFGGKKSKIRDTVQKSSLFNDAILDETNDAVFGAGGESEAVSTVKQSFMDHFDEPVSTNNDLFGGRETIKKTSDLFDSLSPETDDDLFFDINDEEVAKITTTINDNKKKISNLFGESPPSDETVKPTGKSKISLVFGPSSPPPLEEEAEDIYGSDVREVSSTDRSNLSNQVTSMTKKFENDVTNESVVKPIAIIPKSPGKLKHNLNINVGALVPGAAPPKRHESNENQTIEGEMVKNSTLENKKPAVLLKNDSCNETDRRVKDRDVIPASFDSDGGVQVLENVTKDRAKVPAFHRRPSTRRGRKAALKNSTSDFQLYQEGQETSDTMLGESKSLAELQTETVIPPLDDTKPDVVMRQTETVAPVSTDMNKDLVEPVSAVFIPETKATQSQLRQLDSLFDDTKDGDGLFGASGGKTKNPKSTIKSSSLFDDDVDDGDLFGGDTKVNRIKTNKKSLFGDDEDDELFGGFKSGNVVKRTSEPRSASEKKIPKLSSKVIKKLEKSEDDPLSALLK